MVALVLPARGRVERDLFGRAEDRSARYCAGDSSIPVAGATVFDAAIVYRWLSHR